MEDRILYREFGVNAEYLIDHSKGIEPCTISDIKNYETKTTSISNGQILFEDYNREDARLVLKEMVDLLKAYPVHITGKRPVAEAIITSGGVKTAEIDPKTMESKMISGLYFAGEIIDCDAYTGGFNLQIAWATAFVAGTAVKNGD